MLATAVPVATAIDKVSPLPMPGSPASSTTPLILGLPSSLDPRLFLHRQKRVSEDIVGDLSSSGIASLGIETPMDAEPDPTQVVVFFRLRQTQEGLGNERSDLAVDIHSFAIPFIRNENEGRIVRGELTHHLKQGTTDRRGTGGIGRERRG